MSSTTELAEEAAPAGVEPAPAAKRHRAAAVIALARFEARQLLFHIPVFAFLGFYLAFTGWDLFNGREGMDEFPALQDVDRATQAAPQLLGVALLVCVNRTVLRSHRRGTDRHFDVLVMEPWRRTVAHALSVVPYAALTALVVAVQIVWAGHKLGAVGHPSPAELAVGPLAVLLSGVLGVLLARLFRSSFVAPLAVVVAVVLPTMLSSSTGGPRWQQWLSPVVTETGADPFPSELLGRPAAWHALYLVGLIGVLICAAVLVSGGRNRIVQAATAVTLAAMVAGVAGQSQGDSAALLAARTKMSVSPEKFQTCHEYGRSTYCAFPEWDARAALDWAPLVDRVQSLAGGVAGGERLTVRQRIDARYGLTSDSTLEASTTPGTVTVGTRWGGNRVPEFAVGVASVLVAGSEAATIEWCQGDPRAVTVMWLALGAESDPMTAFRNVRLGDSVAGSDLVLAPTNGISLSAEQTWIVRELLQKPRYSVIPKVKSHWTELTSPKTSLARVAELLGVEAASKGAADTDAEEGSCDE
ncbi:ABC transporter permease [Streptomyces sp. NBC_01356]|uniref:ABC transporter permease n=1 Tax=Streptomyces sp. NBC_01356 TaxID=2903836 RepID=UPI002E2F7856|nr:ABC transporter permease [Streptomyces sp. NBC_01356]